MKSELLELLPDMALFCAVAKVKSFSQAARSLRMPVSTLSRRIGELETRIATQLLTRSTRRVELTEAGAAYFARCLTIVETAEAAQSELQDRARSPRGLLRVSTTPDFALTYLTPLLVQFAERYAGVSFEFDMTPRMVDLIAEGFDVAIRMGQLPDSGLTAHRLGTAQRGLYASPAYLERAGRPSEPAELARLACIRLLQPTRVESSWTLLSGELRVEVAVTGRFVANSIRFCLQLAELGVGIVAIDRVMAAPLVEAGRLERVLPLWHPPAIPVHALTPGRQFPTRTQLFLDFLKLQLSRLHREADPKDG